MLSKFKAPLIFTVFTLIFSSFIGFVSGVSFLSILFRSSVLAIISGVFVFAVREVLEKFVPELFQPLDSNEERNSMVGNNVNISIDEPIELSNKDISDDGSLETAVKDENFDNEVSEKISNNAIDNFNEKNQETLKPNSEDNSVKSGLSAENSSEPSYNDSKENVMEELPDLGEFSGYSTQENEFKDKDFTEQGIGAVVSSADVNNSASQVDTNTMVKAIQTILKRDR